MTAVRTLIAVVLIAVVAANVAAQDLPSRIRGYKVHKTDVDVVASGTLPAKRPGIVVTLTEPRVVEIGLAGATIEVGAEIGPPDVSGRIDRISFHDIIVNDIDLAIDDYDHPFRLKKGTRSSLSKPARITIPLTGLARTAYAEAVESKELWTVRGTAFVFGRFKRYGMTFKRVVPIKIDIKVANPLRSVTASFGQ